MKPGLYRISNEQYHSSEGVSRTFLHAILTWSPAHAMTAKEKTAALFDGTAFHCCVLEPLKYNEEYIIKPEGINFTTKDGKAWRSEAEQSGKSIITFEKNQIFLGMAKAIRERLAKDEDPIIQNLLSNGESEISGYWYDPDDSNLICKIRMDWLNKDRGIIVDLKSCEDARPHKFTNDAYRHGYDMQASWYLYGLTNITRIEHHNFYFIACEKKAPHGVQIYKASQEFIDHGLLRCARALAKYRKCKDNSEWPCYPMDVKSLDLPGWVKRRDGYKGVFD